MKVAWKIIPESGFPEGCPETCIIHRMVDNSTWTASNCVTGSYAKRRDYYYADATFSHVESEDPNRKLLEGQNNDTT